jgi:hypothetical protein
MPSLIRACEVRAEEPEGKTKWTKVYLSEKGEMDKSDRGIRLSAVEHDYGVNEATICFVKKNEEVTGSVKASDPSNVEFHVKLS